MSTSSNTAAGVRQVAFPQVLILLTLYLFSGGGGGGGAKRSLEQVVAAHVQDPIQRAEAQAIARRIDQHVGAGAELFVTGMQGLLEVVRSYESSPELLEARFALGDLEWQELQGRMLDLRFQLKDHLTREEWAAVLGEFVEL